MGSDRWRAETVARRLWQRLTGRAPGQQSAPGSAPPEDDIGRERAAGAPDRETQAALVDAFTQMIRLAERLPAGAAEDHVRRSVYEAIEAASEPARQMRVNRLFDSIVLLQRRRAAVTRGQITPDSPVIERLLELLTGRILPLLHRGRRTAG